MDYSIKIFNRLDIFIGFIGICLIFSLAYLYGYIGYPEEEKKGKMSTLILGVLLLLLCVIRVKTDFFNEYNIILNDQKDTMIKVTKEEYIELKNRQKLYQKQALEEILK